jgi:transcriptional regulator with XRE-family HTH domain
MGDVTELEIGRVVRAIRHKLGLRQVDVARRSGVPRGDISDIENDRLWRVSVPKVARVLAAMDARLDLRVRWRGAAMDRLLDEGHARLAGAVTRLLIALGWVVEVEVSFSRNGDRGSIDILAWHAATQTLLVIEIKTELASIEGLLRPLDLKVRHAAAVARERFGLDARSVGRLVVMPETSQSRRAVASHAAVLGAALPQRGVEIRRWLRQPVGTLSGLWLLSSAALVGTKQNPSARQRVRRPRREAA